MWYPQVLVLKMAWYQNRRKSGDIRAEWSLIQRGSGEQASCGDGQFPEIGPGESQS